jgi:hypothetical protein
MNLATLTVSSDPDVPCYGPRFVPTSWEAIEDNARRAFDVRNYDADFRRHWSNYKGGHASLFRFFGNATRLPITFDTLPDDDVFIDAILRSSAYLDSDLDALRHYTARNHRKRLATLFPEATPARKFPRWLADGTADGRTKFGRALNRWKMDDVAGYASRLAQIPATLARLRGIIESGGSLSFSFICEAPIFYRLGKFRVCKKANSCYGNGEEHSKDPGAIAQSPDTFVGLFKVYDDANPNGDIRSRCWGFLQPKRGGMIATNFYGESLDVIAARALATIAADTILIPPFISSTLARRCASIDERSVYVNGDKFAIGTVGNCGIDDDGFSDADYHCDDCGCALYDDDARHTEYNVYCETCFDEHYIHDEDGEVIDKDSAVTTYAGEIFHEDVCVWVASCGEYAHEDDDNLRTTIDGKQVIVE